MGHIRCVDKKIVLNGRTKYQEVYDTVMECIQNEIHSLKINVGHRNIMSLSVSHSITYRALSASAIGGSGEWCCSVLITYIERI